MKTTSQRTEWPQVNEMFERLLDLPLQEQEEELRRFKEERPELARRVRDLLEADRRAEDFLQPPWPSASRSSPDGVVEGEEWVLGPSAITGTDDPLPLEGQVGPYRLTRCLGRGGMGVVYRGERADGRYDGQVAVKFLHSPRASPEVLRRFQQETSILARLEHPNIARLIDSGETPSGRPYLILEYVEGSPIDVFCRRRDLSLQERIRLFLKVCQAADFAHQHLVVHRDIKPENLLVTDGGEPKLLDFGIAKLLEMEGAEALTQGSLRPMTPRYASPEQRAAGTITVATDVYSLGLVLHHLLRGCLPGAEPPPEAAMSESLPQDLQGILEKALEEDPGCRYRSAGAFASDLENFLEGRPVEARPATAFYRFRKLVARNRLLSTLSGVLLLSLLGFSVAMSHQVSSLRKKQSLLEREQARKDRLLETVIDLFQLADPWQGSTEDLTVRSALKANAGTLRERFHGDPDLQVEIAMAVGTIYHRLNLHEEALEQFEAARRLALEHFGPRHSQTGEVLEAMGMVKRSLGEWQEALRLTQEAIDVQRTLGEESALLDAIVKNLAIRCATGAVDGTTPLSEEALALTRDPNSPHHEAFGIALGHSASLASRLGDHERAAQLAKQAVEWSERRGDQGLNDFRDELSNLGSYLRRSGHLEEAEGYFLRALDHGLAQFGRDHPSFAHTLNNLGVVTAQLGRTEEAYHYFQRARDVIGQEVSTEHPWILQYDIKLAQLDLDQGYAMDAVARLEPDLPFWKESQGRFAFLVVEAEISLANALAKSGRVERGGSLLRGGLASAREAGATAACSSFREQLLRLAQDHPETLAGLRLEDLEADAFCTARPEG